MSEQTSPIMMLKASWCPGREPEELLNNHPEQEEQASTCKSFPSPRAIPYLQKGLKVKIFEWNFSWHRWGMLLNPLAMSWRRYFPRRDKVNEGRRKIARCMAPTLLLDTTMLVLTNN